MKLQPGVARATPTQVFLKNPLQRALLGARELELHGQGNLAASVQSRDVVAELHGGLIDRLTRAIGHQEIHRGDDLFDEHRARAFRSGREKVQVLPHRAPHRARNADIMLEPRPTLRHGAPNQLGDGRAALGAHPSVRFDGDGVCTISHNQTAEPAVADQDIGSKAEHEDGDFSGPGGLDSGSEFVCRGGIVQHVRGTADAERGVRSQRLVEAQSVGAEGRGQCRGNLSRCQRDLLRTGCFHRMRVINRYGSRLASGLGFVAALFVSTPIVAQRAPQAGAAVGSHRAELERTIQRRVLANGLEVIIAPSRGVPIATVELVVKNGAFTQPPEYAGLAHLFEHMFFKANESYPEPDTFVDRAADLGALFNATTREELVSYYLTVVNDSVEGGLRFLSAALRGAQFRADELAREKEVVLGEYDRAESSPWFRLDETIGHQLWGSFWSRKNTIGDRAVIRSVTSEQMRTIRDLYYVPNNSALVIAGDVDPTAMFALVERVLGDWPRGVDPFVRSPVPAVPPLPANRGIIVEEDVNAVTVQIQWHGPSASRDQAATFAADVYSDVLNQPGSRFQERLVESGLWQGVVVNYYTLNHVGPITVSGQTTPERLRDALAALHTELRATLESGYFKADELESVKANRAVTTAFGQERASENAHTIGFWWSVIGLDYHLRYIDEMAKQTPADLQRYARQFIVGRPHITGVMLPRGATRALNLTEAELAGLGGAR